MSVEDKIKKEDLEFTHYLRCRHAIGQHGKDYLMPCNILKEMGNGRVKLEVFGDRYWKDTYHIKKIRYVGISRLAIKPTQAFNIGE